MKKILSIITICMLPLMGANAQEKIKKDYLPKQGDWAVGVDVIPLIKYIGNTFSDTKFNDDSRLGGTPFTKGNEKFNLVPDISIMGKYMMTDNIALRANLGLMIRSEQYRGYSADDRAAIINPLGEEKVIDVCRRNANGMSLALGAEYRKGTKRVQGVFGAGVLFAFQTEKYSFDWGNEMTVANQTPSSSTLLGYQYQGGHRLTESKESGNFYTGITGSVGVEWFVAPKISLGAEVNLTAYYLFGSQSYSKAEGYNPSIDKIEEKTDLASPGDRGFYLGTESLGGSLNMIFYF